MCYFDLFTEHTRKLIVLSRVQKKEFKAYQLATQDALLPGLYVLTGSVVLEVFMADTNAIWNAIGLPHSPLGI